MSKKPFIEKNTDEILNSLGGIQRAVPRPFFYGRTMAKLNQQQDSRWERIVGFLSQPTIAVATVVFFLLINAVVLFRSSENATPASQDESNLATDNEYNNLSVSSLYDINPYQNDIAQK
ncbi:MAG TPA: hypothetical protein VET23_15765 [Chitinophagaceae bacterium]|nr:hypothetical protein [Chitinophagaceae bacterium]